MALGGQLTRRCSGSDRRPPVLAGSGRAAASSSAGACRPRRPGQSAWGEAARRPVRALPSVSGLLEELRWKTRPARGRPRPGRLRARRFYRRAARSGKGTDRRCSAPRFWVLRCVSTAARLRGWRGQLAACVWHGVRLCAGGLRSPGSHFCGSAAGVAWELRRPTAYYPAVLGSPGDCRAGGRFLPLASARRRAPGTGRAHHHVAGFRF